MDILWLHFRFTSVDGPFVFDEVIIDTVVLLSEKGYIFTITIETVIQNVTVRHVRQSCISVHVIHNAN
jgi:uncharacterized membrane protein YiaA